MKHSEKHRKDHYSGMRTGSRVKKYADCQYVEVTGGNRVRLMTDVEIDEFQAYIERLKKPGLRTPPVMRRSIV